MPFDLVTPLRSPHRLVLSVHGPVVGDYGRMTQQGSVGEGDVAAHHYHQVHSECHGVGACAVVISMIVLIWRYDSIA